MAGKGRTEQQPLTRADILMHPIRIRILVGLTGRQMTTPQLVEALPDVPQASLYRHINKLCEAGVLEVVESAAGRGGVEKTYALAEPDINLGETDLANASYEDHLRYFTTFVATLTSQGRAYLQQKALDGRKGGIYGYEAVYLSDEEYTHYLAALRALEGLARSYPSGNGRRRRIIFTAIIPDVNE